MLPHLSAAPSHGSGSHFAVVETNDGLEIEVASEGIGGHELAMELLLCLGQALWETSEAGDSFLKLLAAEIDAGVPGEIDEESLRENSRCFKSRIRRSRIRLERYAARPSQARWPNTSIASGMMSRCGPAASICRRLGCGVAWSGSLAGSRRIAVTAYFRATHNAPASLFASGACRRGQLSARLSDS